MCDQQSLRPACAYAQSDQSLCLSFEYSMSVKLLTKQHLEFVSLKRAAQAGLSVHLSKCHIVGKHMSRLICVFYLSGGQVPPQKLAALQRVLQSDFLNAVREVYESVYETVDISGKPELRANATAKVINRL